MIDWPAKAPAEVADYAFDWTESLDEGETIATRTVSAEGVTVNSSAIVGGLVRVWLSGGTEGILGKVTALITTSGGRTFEELALLPIGEGPIDLARAKAHLRVDYDRDDARIAMLLRAAVAAVENYTGRVLSPKPIVQYARRFPTGVEGDERIELWRDPVVAVTLVEYRDQADAVQELDAADYRSIEGEPWSLVAPLAGSFPATAERRDAVKIRYVAGYEAGDCPPDLQMAVLETLRAAFDGTEEVDPASGLPRHVKGWCWPYRRIRL